MHCSQDLVLLLQPGNVDRHLCIFITQISYTHGRHLVIRDGHYLAYYEPYDAWYPQKQVKLLLLYDELGLPHAKNKQVFGHSLEIISLLVDPIKMTISCRNPLAMILSQPSEHLSICQNQDDGLL